MASAIPLSPLSVSPYSPPSPSITHIESSPSSPSHASWVEKIRTQARSEQFKESLQSYISMTSSGFTPDNFTFPAVLKSAAAVQNLELGKQIHAVSVKLGFQTYPVTIPNTLITFYAKCGDLGCARKVFDGIPEKDQVSWNSMMGALCMFEEWVLSLELFRWMVEKREEVSSFTLVSAASACANLRGSEGIKLGKQIHCYGLRRGLYSRENSFSTNSLMSMYAKLGRIKDSFRLFEHFGSSDVVTWNTVISLLTQNGHFNDAIHVMREMLGCMMMPDGVTMSSIIPACSGLENFKWGREIHAYVVKHAGLSDNSFVGSALVDMYCNFGKIAIGRKIFDRLVERRLGLWNAMIAGYSQSEMDDDALDLFLVMRMNFGLMPDETTVSSVIPSCLRSVNFPIKESIHGYVVKRGFEGDRYVQNALLDMYARRGNLHISEKIFRRMEDKDVVSWNTMIVGYVLNESYHDAFNFVRLMQHDDHGLGHGNSTKPNCITLISILPVCALLAALGKGREIHAYAIRNHLDFDIAVGSAIVDMYAKCGSLEHARRSFNRMVRRNVVTWNVLIMAYGMNGQGKEALDLLHEMMIKGREEGGVKPNEVTFISVFAACSHSGMVNEGLEIFDRMESDYGFKPTPEHYACVVDLLGRAGKLARAYDLINSMESGPNRAGAWSSLLGACRVHKNVELGEIAAKNLLQLEPNIASHYVLLSNIYAEAKRWDEAMEVRRIMKDNGVIKEPGYSWIELGDEVHEFMVGDLLHPKNEKVRVYLESLWERMKREGYKPDTSCVLHDVDERDKEMILCGHSEKVAIAFGIVNSPPGAIIRVAKNLRVCNDCHSAAKFMAKILGREIVLRDTRRFHHFKDGSCSCGDYW